MKNLLLKTTLISSLAGMAACNQEAGPGHFPLTEGMTWQYHVEQLTLTLPVKYKMLMTNLGKHEVDGQQYYLKQSQNDALQYYNEDETGLFRLIEQEPEDSDTGIAEKSYSKQYLFHYPLQVGTRWQGLSTPFLMKRSIEQINAEQNSMPGLSQKTPLEMTYEIESIDETVEVPAGKFKGCMKIVGKGSCTFSSVGSFARKITVDVENKDWFCPGAGLVKVRRDEISQRVSLDSVYYTIELERIDR